MSVLTFLSDFGKDSHYTASFRGAMYKNNMNIPFVEIANHTCNNTILESAFLSNMVFADFPTGSFHVIAVGTTAYAHHFHLIARYKGHYFLAANNGILSLIFNTDFDAYFAIPNTQGVVNTHELYLPVIQQIQAGRHLEEFLEPMSQVEKKIGLRPTFVSGDLTGSVVFVDDLGNVFTNIFRDDFNQYFSDVPFQITLSKHHVLDKISEDLSVFKPGDIYAFFTKHGYLSVSIRDGSAEELLNLRLYKSITIQTK